MPFYIIVQICVFTPQLSYIFSIKLFFMSLAKLLLENSVDDIDTVPDNDEDVNNDILTEEMHGRSVRFSAYSPSSVHSSCILYKYVQVRWFDEHGKDT